MRELELLRPEVLFPDFYSDFFVEFDASLLLLYF